MGIHDGSNVLGTALGESLGAIVGMHDGVAVDGILLGVFVGTIVGTVLYN